MTVPFVWAIVASDGAGAGWRQQVEFMPSIRAGGSACDVAVVGAGVFGAWTAHHLLRDGARVALMGDPHQLPAVGRGGFRPRAAPVDAHSVG